MRKITHTHSNISICKVKWSNPGKSVVPFPTIVVAIEKKIFRWSSTKVTNFPLIFLLIYT